MKPEKHAGGRPTKLTPELTEQIRVAVAAGNYLETACGYCGVSKQTLYTWMRLGHDEGPDGIHRKFLDAMEKAMSSSEARAVALIGDAARTQWQAAAWFLERTRPQKFGRKTEMVGPNGGPIQLDVGKVREYEQLSDVELIRRFAQNMTDKTLADAVLKVLPEGAKQDG